MSIRVIDDGEGGFTLLSPDDTVIGWVHGRVVGVTGFEDPAAASAAGARAHQALGAWLARQQLAPLRSLDESPLRFMHDDARDRHAFEIALQGQLNDGIAIHAALIAQRVSKDQRLVAEITWPPRARLNGTSGMVTPTTMLPVDVW